MARIVLFLSLLFTCWAFAQSGGDSAAGVYSDADGAQAPCVAPASKGMKTAPPVPPVDGKCEGELVLVNGECVSAATQGQ